MGGNRYEQKPASKRKTSFEVLFEPAFIAVIGASNDALKPGGRVFKSLKDHGYAGDLWPVNPKADHIVGLPAFKTVAELPCDPDLAIISIPVPFVLPA